MERASTQAQSAPWANVVRASVVSATEGAAANSPANPLGRSRSPSSAKRLTMVPPRRKRTTSCDIGSDCKFGVKAGPGLSVNVRYASWVLGGRSRCLGIRGVMIMTTPCCFAGDSSMNKLVRAVCAHDCPDLCSLLVSVKDGRVTGIRGDPEHSFTAGFTCGKTSRDHELVNSPERLLAPLRRVGPKGQGRFEPMSWERALGEITDRWQRIIAESGPLALLGYAYSAHTGLMNRGLINGLFHALGASRLDAGTVCDSCSIAAWNATLGPVGGADPESIVDSDLLISWGCDLITTNVHFWARISEQRKRGLEVVVIDPRRSRTAQHADWHLPIRIGTDAALAL